MADGTQPCILETMAKVLSRRKLSLATTQDKLLVLAWLSIQVTLTVKLLSYLVSLILPANRFLFSQIPSNPATAIPPIADGSGTALTLTLSKYKKP